MSSAIGHSTFRAGGFTRFDGAANGAWGFGHDMGYAHHGEFGRGYGRFYRGPFRNPYGRYDVASRYGIAGGDIYGYGAPAGYGYGDEAYERTPYAGASPEGFGASVPYSAYGSGRFGAERGYGAATPIGVYSHSGDGAYAYGYNGYSETPLPPFTRAWGHGYGSLSTAYAYPPSTPSCGC